MLTSAHTLGPWTIKQEGDDYVVKGAPGTTRVFSIRTGVIPMPNDARLVAAAPRMLALLQEYADKARDVMTPAPGSLIERTRAILRDVEGESHGR